MSKYVRQWRKRISVKIQKDKYIKETEKDRMIDILVEKLQLSNVEVSVAFDKFVEIYPKAEISKDDFLKETQGNILAETLFEVFDKNRRGALNFYEFMMVKNISKLESPEEKLNGILCSCEACVIEIREAISMDGDGPISKEEFLQSAMKSSLICKMVNERIGT